MAVTWLLGILAWWVIGMGGFIYWWTYEFDLEQRHLSLVPLIGLSGPFAWLIGLWVHGGKAPRGWTREGVVVPCRRGPRRTKNG